MKTYLSSISGRSVEPLIENCSQSWSQHYPSGVEAEELVLIQGKRNIERSSTPLLKQSRIGRKEVKNTNHDWKCTFFRSRLSKSFTDKVHIRICLFGETHSEKDVDGKTRVSNPAETIIPISNHQVSFRMYKTYSMNDLPHTTYMLRD